MKAGNKYFQIVIYFLLLIVLVFFMGAFRNCGKIKAVPVIGYSGGDTIDLAIIYGPRSLYIYNDTLGGLNKELALSFSHDTKTPVKIWPVTNSREAMDKLNEGAFDVLASMPLDNKIKENFLSSESLFLDRQVLIQSSDTNINHSQIHSSLDLIGKEVHIAEGSTALQRLNNLSNEIGGEIKIVEENLSEEFLCIKVAKGEIDYAVVNEKTADDLKKEYPLLSSDNPISFSQFQVWLFNPADSVLQLRFSEWFDEFRKTGSYQEILNRY